MKARSFMDLMPCILLTFVPPSLSVNTEFNDDRRQQALTSRWCSGIKIWTVHVFPLPVAFIKVNILQENKSRHRDEVWPAGSHSWSWWKSPETALGAATAHFHSFVPFYLLDHPELNASRAEATDLSVCLFTKPRFVINLRGQCDSQGWCCTWKIAKC